MDTPSEIRVGVAVNRGRQDRAADRRTTDDVTASAARNTVRGTTDFTPTFDFWLPEEEDGGEDAARGNRRGLSRWVVTPARATTSIQVGRLSTLPSDVSATELGLSREVEILSETAERGPLVDLLDRPGLVLLGDPGLGKTVSMQAAAEGRGLYLTVRRFLNRPAREFDGQALFLDALDEAMAARGNTTPLDTVAERLQEIGRPPFWLSCRPADWALAGGRSVLEDCTPTGLTVARLLPISDDQIATAIRAVQLQPDDVIRSMADAGLLPLLGNPLTLRLTLGVFAAGGPPRSRSDLYARATALLVQETNTTHAGQPGRPTEAEILTAAGAISALLLISGNNAVARPPADLDGAVSTAALDALASAQHVAAALRTRLFLSSGEDTWEPQHRTIAEYLGASFLADLVAKKGQPLGRMLALLSGGGIAPDPSLRGLFAWFATLLPDRAEEMVGRDPYAVVSYGDPAQLRTSAMRALLEGLRRLVDEEPFFRAGAWAEARFGALAVPELVPEFRGIIAQRPVKPHLLSCVLDALETGAPRPELVPDLAAFLADGALPRDARSSAVTAFVHAAQSDALAGPNLFRRLLSDNVADPRAHLTGQLLLCLYPQRLTTADLVAFLDRFVTSDAGRGDRLHLSWRLPPLIPKGEEASVLDALSAHPWVCSETKPLSRLEEIRRVARALAARALNAPDQSPPHRVAAWLPLLNGGGTGERQEQAELASALAARQDLLVPLTLAAVRLPFRKQQLRPWQAGARLRGLLPCWEWPDDAASRLLEAALTEADSGAARVLFGTCIWILAGTKPLSDPTFERACVAASSRAIFADLMDRCCALEPWADWRKDDAARSRRQKAAAQRRRAADIASLEARVTRIQTGIDEEAMVWLAQRWFDFHERDEVDGGAAPPQRLRSVVPENIARAAEQGFRSLATTGEVPPPDEIARHCVANGKPWAWYAILAGADLLFADAGDGLPTVSADRLVSLLCMGLTLSTHTTIEKVTHTDKRPWIGRIVAAFPKESFAAVRTLLRTQVDARVEFVEGLHEVCHDDDFIDIRRRLLPELLELVEAPGSPFDVILFAALRDGARTDVEPIARRRAAFAGCLPPIQRWPWLHLAWRLSPADFKASLLQAVAVDESLVDSLVGSTGDTTEGFRDNLPLPLTLEHRELVVRITGPRFPPAPVPEGGWSPPTPYDRARYVHRHIKAIGDTQDQAAEALLVSLLSEPSLAAHRDYLMHALASWRRDARLRACKRPGVEALARALSGGGAATSADLQALVAHHLFDLGATLRRTADNVWRFFWNLDGHEKLIAACPENVCRDRLAHLLRARFEAAGLAQDTEVRFANNTRCDIVAGRIGAIVPIEVKCDWNPALWTAWRDQLDAQYASDLRADGRGVYLVLWFGAQRGGSRGVSAPTGMDVPASAVECAQMLHDVMQAHRDRLVPIVFDVSPM